MYNLSDQAKTQYEEEGYLAPLTALEKDELDPLRDRILHLGSAREGQLPPALNFKPHLLVPDLWNLVHAPRIVEPVVDILGQDVLCWVSSFFDKAPGTAKHVHWHQDSTFWGLERPDALTVWVAFTPSNRTNGCMRVLPKSHGDQMRHIYAEDPENMLRGGEVLASPVDESEVRDIELAPGEMSLHHQRLVHGSRPNTGKERRMGFAIRYIAGDLKGLQNDQSFATLVHGEDRGGFQIETAPERDLDPQALRRHGKILRKFNEIVNREVKRHNEASA